MGFRIDIVTLFPEIVENYFSSGIISQGIKKNLVEVHTHYLRDFVSGNYKQVDDRVFGGGAGMLLMFEPIAKAIESIRGEYSKTDGTDGADRSAYPKVIATSAQGEIFKQSKANSLAEESGLIILCGRYEGFDQRIIDELVDYEISLGQFVVTGGELPALIIADSVLRLQPGVLGKSESYEHDSFYSSDDKVQHPQYTRPEVIEYLGKELKVPEVLLSGNHAEITKWRENNTRKLNGQNETSENEPRE